jgi:phage protein D
MSQVDIAKKYSNFFAPKNQIIVNNEDILEKYGVQSSAITIEEVIGVLSKFTFTVNYPQFLLKGNGLFELKKNALIKIGYANTLETIIEGDINTIKTIFPSNGPPQIEVNGQAKTSINSTLSTKNKPLLDLTYGKTLISFTSTTSTQEQVNRTVTIARKSAVKAQASNLCCSGECIGVPDLKVREIIALNGIGKKYDGCYYVEKVSHELKVTGYTTKFEARTP